MANAVTPAPNASATQPGSSIYPYTIDPASYVQAAQQLMMPQQMPVMPQAARGGASQAMPFTAMLPVMPQATHGGASQAIDRKSTRLNSSHVSESRMPSSA